MIKGFNYQNSRKGRNKHPRNGNKRFSSFNFNVSEKFEAEVKYREKNWKGYKEHNKGIEKLYGIMYYTEQSEDRKKGRLKV